MKSISFEFEYKLYSDVLFQIKMSPFSKVRNFLPIIMFEEIAFIVAEEVKEVL